MRRTYLYAAVIPPRRDRHRMQSRRGGIDGLFTESSKLYRKIYHDKTTTHPLIISNTDIAFGHELWLRYDKVCYPEDKTGKTLSQKKGYGPSSY